MQTYARWLERELKQVKSELAPSKAAAAPRSPLKASPEELGVLALLAEGKRFYAERVVAKRDNNVDGGYSSRPPDSPDAPTTPQEENTWTLEQEMEVEHRRATGLMHRYFHRWTQLNRAQRHVDFGDRIAEFGTEVFQQRFLKNAIRVHPNLDAEHMQKASWPWETFHGGVQFLATKDPNFREVPVLTAEHSISQLGDMHRAVSDPGVRFIPDLYREQSC
ncbi:unnamed protein product [Amoebophrya sp. A25]|nr:unnamed protein product [Amoebophrya sp. A25]|eukprot:GSA25T00019686001.1